MMSCWNEDGHKRPRFSEMVITFSGLLETDAGYLQLSLTPQKGNSLKQPTESEKPIVIVNEAAKPIGLD